MERFTYFDGGKWRMQIGNTEYSGPEADRLAAYENTGLEPWEITRIVDEYGHGHTLRTHAAERLELIREIPTDRLRELVEADRDGRCVVLPISTPSMAYTVDQKGGYISSGFYVTPGAVLHDTERGYIIAKTREAAESALKGEQDGQ